MEKKEVQVETNIKFNEEDVRRFYRFFKHELPTEIRVFDEKKYPMGKSVWVKTEDEFVEKCRFFCEEEGVSVYIGARDRKDKGDLNVYSSNFIFFEIDEHGEDKNSERDKILKFLEENNIQVSMQGMSGGGWHFYIPHNKALFEKEEVALKYKGQSLASFKKVLEEKGFDIDSKVFNLERVTRVLGTFNYKRGKISRIDYIQDVDEKKNSESLNNMITNHVPKETSSNYKTEVGEDDFIKSVKEKWKEGNRQNLALSLAGYLRKVRKLGLKSSLEIIEGIAKDCNDNEINQRLLAVRNTYDKDESEVIGYTGMIKQGIEIKEKEEVKDGIIWSDNFDTWDIAKKKSYIESKASGELKFYAHKKDVIKGKPAIYDNTKRTIINIITTGEKTDPKTEEVKKTFKFLDEHYDKRFDGAIKETFSKAYWVYTVIDDDGNEYIVLMNEKNHSSEVQYFYGMNVEVENSNEISTDFKAKGKRNIFFCHSSKPTIKPLPKEEIIPYTEIFMKEHGFVKEVFGDFFQDLIFTHEDGNIYRQPKDYMLMRHAQLLSGKVNGYPLSTLSLGVAGCSKTMEVESIDHVFGEGVLEAGNSTVKSLIPSFKEKPASAGFIMEKNRIAMVDELMKMVDKQMEGNASTNIIRNQLSQLNYLLEHKKRAVGSGNNNSFVGQATAKIIMVGNPAGKMNYLSDHLKVLDESTLSRFFIWIKGFEHKKFIQSNKILKSRNIHPIHIHVSQKKGVCIEKVFRDFIYDYYLTIYDSCQVFIVEVDYSEIERLYQEVLALVPLELKNVWSARGRHHTELIVDGITKWNRIFIQQKDDFVARREDYEQAEKILIKMAQSWSEGLQLMY